MLKLGLDAIERFVKGHPAASWDGWTVVMWEERRGAEQHPRGARRGDKWGIESRISPNAEGKWVIRV